MFSHCSSLLDIKALENWNVSNVNNFSYMFNNCSSLSEIKALQNWNVSNVNNFSYMFSHCSSLSDIKALQNWIVSNGNDFSYMFFGCKTLRDIKALENWNVSNGNNFENMFSGCKSLSDLKIVQIQKLMNDLEIFFSCIYCKNIVSHPYSCSCQKFICEKCFINNEKKELCSFCHKKFVKENNSDIDNLVSEIFKDQKIIKEKINFYILLSEDLKSLYLKKKLKLILNYSSNYSHLSSQEEKNLIDNISNEKVFESLKDYDKSFIPINILDYISTVGDLIDNYIKKNKYNIIDINRALSNKKGTSLYISGILARLLMNDGINVAIEKETNFPKLSKNLLEWLMIGLLKFKKIILKLDYGKKKNEEILENEKKKKKIKK
jgi:surface protein